MNKKKLDFDELFDERFSFLQHTELRGRERKHTPNELQKQCARGVKQERERETM
jgi:hypothetical protein